MHQYTTSLNPQGKKSKGKKAKRKRNIGDLYSSAQKEIGGD